MAKMGKFQVKGLKELQKELDRMQKDRDRFLESCARELAARLLRLVVKRTPVGDYRKEIKVTAKRDSKNHKKGDVYTKKVNLSGKQGGTLRRGWISETQKEAESDKRKPQAPEILEYVNKLEIRKEGGIYKIDITNPVEYASYVEYGHRTADHRGWVKGHFMLAISEQELENIAPKVLERKIKKYLEGYLK